MDWGWSFFGNVLFGKVDCGCWVQLVHRGSFLSLDEFGSQLAHPGQTFFAVTKESLIQIKIRLNWCVFLVKRSALEFVY